MNVLLTGATGFVGSHILQRLLAEGHTVRALARSGVTRVQHPHLTQISGDVVSGAGLDEAAQGCQAVIHLVGIIIETKQQTFERVHHLGTRNVVEAARRADVSRFVQMSALGARHDGVSAYQTSKWRGEEAVRASGVPYVVLRPSIIFGPGDGFVSQMADVMRTAPLLRPVPGNGKYRFRPVYIDDVVTCFVSALSYPLATGRTIDLVGGEELPLEDVLARIANCIGVRKPAVRVPFGMMYAGATVLSRVLKHPPVTPDQLRMLREGSTADPGPMREVFKIDPVGFTEGLRRYLCKTKYATSTDTMG